MSEYTFQRIITVDTTQKRKLTTELVDIGDMGDNGSVIKKIAS